MPQLPKQFTPYRRRRLDDNGRPIRIPRIPPVVPPLYPVLVDGITGENKFIPYNGFPILEPRDNRGRVTGPYLGKSMQDKLQIYAFDGTDKKSIFEKEMEKLPWQTDNTQCDGMTTRLGIDGWLYRYKPNGRDIGEYETHYYRLKWTHDRTTTLTQDHWV